MAQHPALWGAVIDLQLGDENAISLCRRLVQREVPFVVHTGHSAEAVHREFGLAEDEVPVMLLSVGPVRPGNWLQKPRRPVADVLEFA